MSKMKLFRGYETEPKRYTPELQRHIDALTDIYEKCNKDDIAGFFTEFHEKSGEGYEVYLDLLGIAGTQFFSDQKKVAEAFAKPGGFIMEIEIDDGVAQAHYSGTEQVFVDALNASFPCSNFAFTGEEIERLEGEGALTVEIKAVPRAPLEHLIKTRLR